MDDRDESRMLSQLLSHHWQMVLASFGCSHFLLLLLMVVAGVLLMLHYSTDWLTVVGESECLARSSWSRRTFSVVWDVFVTVYAALVEWGGRVRCEVVGPAAFVTPADGQSEDCQWRGRRSVCVAVQGPRASMEDRFCSEEILHLNDSLGEVCLYGVFDGHGGQFAADYCRSHMLSQLKRQLVETHETAALVLARLRPSDSANHRDSSTSRSSDDFQHEKSPSATFGSSASDCSGEISSAAKSVPVLSNSDVSEETVIVSSDECSDDLATGEPPIGETANCTTGRQYDVYSSMPSGASSRHCRQLISRLGRVSYSQLLQLVFSAVDEKLLEAGGSECVAGSTAVVVMWLRSQRHLVVAGCGDSRAVGCDRSGRVSRLTTDHLPNLVEEKQRVLSAGGTVLLNGVWRVNGSLAVSRAMGDLPFKKQGVITCRPDVSCVDLVGGGSGTLQFVLVATDGLWDTVSPEEACQRTLCRLHEPMTAVKALVRLALLRGSSDNVTVMLVDVREHS